MSYFYMEPGDAHRLTRFFVEEARTALMDWRIEGREIDRDRLLEEAQRLLTRAIKLSKVVE